MNSARYVAGINPIDSSKALVRKPGYDVVFNRADNGLEASSIIPDDLEHLSRWVGGAGFNALEAIACSVMAPDILESLTQDVEGPRPEEDYDLPRSLARALAWASSEFGSVAAYRGNRDASDPLSETKSNANVDGVPGYTALRYDSLREGPLPGGRVTGDGTAQGTPGGVRRLNYSAEDPELDPNYTPTWNIWQHSYMAMVADALIELFRSQGRPDSDPLIQNILAVARNTYYALRSQEQHPSADEAQAPRPGTSHSRCSARNQGSRP